MAKRNVFFIDADQVRKNIPGPLLVNKLKAFDAYFQNELFNVTENLAKSGVTVARRAIREAKTEWGKSRMSGNHFGVRFAPYGRGEGREDTGFMYDSLSYDVELTGAKNVWNGVFGWPVSAIERTKKGGEKSYIEMQENGFFGSGKFDPIATAASGRAKFREGAPKWIPGAKSLPQAAESIRKRAQAAYSAAWNEATRKWYSDGFKTSPGTYRQARERRAGRRMRF